MVANESQFIADQHCPESLVYMNPCHVGINAGGCVMGVLRFCVTKNQPLNGRAGQGIASVGPLDEVRPSCHH